MAGIFGYTKFKGFDTNGALLAGGKLYTYQAGTTTPATTYADNTLSPASANTNPIILDSIGEALIWGTGMYKFVLKDANDVTIWTVDNVVPGGVKLPLAISDGGTGAATTAAARAALGLGDFSTYTPTPNTVLYIDSAGDIQKVALGANGTALISKGATAAPVFSAAAAALDPELAAIAALVSTAGKGIRYTGSGVAELITITDFAKTLLDDATSAAARSTLGITSGGEWEELTASKTTANNSANVAFTGLDETTYDYRVVMRAVKPGTTGTTLRLETGYGPTPTYRASDYSVAISGVDQGGTAANVVSVDQAIAVISAALATASADAVHADIQFNWNGLDAVTAYGNGATISPSGGTNPGIKSMAIGIINYTNGLSALRFTMSSGNIASGVFRLFRRAK